MDLLGQNKKGYNVTSANRYFHAMREGKYLKIYLIHQNNIA